ncbi:hypothetical protein CkaCkLH20_05874 [Colletotrichum karsti]|uniref:C3H1-type domain-containing protein n=1 Tax=Colletotrichum karsti TaxID=1095194 RepID=A0A9P6LKS2_9PEZI|nr:uncharacterized protein CkaCkLH20_05874 [Colletotrichum karsti]KAF9876466.1 hypothetical protein CkaCkLH20_05874 [Colletotrichum karsti]
MYPEYTMPAATPSADETKGLSQSMHNPHNAGQSTRPKYDSPPRPEHFVVRKGPEGNTIVPLIPIDMLPDYVELVGVPRVLTIKETTSMKNLGEYIKQPGQYRLHFVASPLEKAYDTPSNDGKEVLGKAADEDSSFQREKPALEILPDNLTGTSGSGSGSAKKTVRPETKTRSKAAPVQAPPPAVPTPPRRVLDWADDTESVSTDDFSGAENSSGSSRNNGKRRDNRQDKTMSEMEKSTAETADRMLKVAAAASAHRLAPTRSASAPMTSSSSGKKKTSKPKFSRPAGSLCRHWCQTGQCSFGTDCRYTHQMPVTLEDLADVGLMELPVWWRKLAGLPSEGTIDVRIFSAASAVAAGSSDSGSSSSSRKKSPGPASAGASPVVYLSKKTKLRAHNEERRLAEEFHAVRLGVERAQASASPVPIAGENGKRKMGSGSAGILAKKPQQEAEPVVARVVPASEPVVEKLVDI